MSRVLKPTEEDPIWRPESPFDSAYEHINKIDRMAERFIAFHHRFQHHFQRGARSVFLAASFYLKGLMQAERKNMERMEEAVVGAHDQQLKQW